MTTVVQKEDTGFAAIAAEMEQPLPELTEQEVIEEIEYNDEQAYDAGVTQGEDIETPDPVANIPNDITEENPELKQVDETPAKQEEPKVEYKKYIPPAILRMKSPDEFKGVVAGIHSLVDEATFELTPEGLAFRAMDPSHIALVDVNVPNCAFERFECSEPLKFAVRVDDLVKMLKEFDDKTSLEILIDLNAEMQLTLKGEGIQYNMRTIETSASSTPLPKLHFNTTAQVTTSVFGGVLDAIQKMSEYVTITSKHGRLDFVGSGDAGNASRFLESGMEGLEELSVKEESKATFSLDYIQKIQKAMAGKKPKAVGRGRHRWTPSEKRVTLQYSTKMPLLLEYKVADVGRLHFYLAPRVQD